MNTKNFNNHIVAVLKNAVEFSKQDANDLYNELTALCVKCAKIENCNLEFTSKAEAGSKVERSAHFQAFYTGSKLYITNKYF